MSKPVRNALLIASLWMLLFAGGKMEAPAVKDGPAAIVALILSIGIVLIFSGTTEKGEPNIVLPTGGKPGRDLETFVKRVLRAQGWELDHLPKSQDRGADVRASRGSIRLIVQCKDYSKPVGYTALKDIHAARAHYPSKHVCVVSRTPFTRQAIDAAEKMDIKLVDQKDFQAFAKRLT